MGSSSKTPSAMLVTEVHYESRNLGVKCALVKLNPDDRNPDLVALKDNFAMITVRSPVGRPDLSKSISAQGFWYCDSQLTLRRTLSGYRAEFAESVSLNCLSEEEALESLLQNGFSIESDRLELLRVFDSNLLFGRYSNWISDELSLGALFFEISIRSRPAGFFIGRIVNEKPYVALSGTYSKCSFPGAGSLIESHMLQWAASINQHLDVVVASSNCAALRLHFAFGFNLLRIEDEFIWTSLESKVGDDV